MPTGQAPNRRPRKTGPARLPTAGPVPLTEFFRTQAEAIEAARARGIEEMFVTFRPNAPGARNVKAKVRTDDIVKLWASLLAGQVSGVEPTEKLARAINEAAEVNTFYKTKEELFDALERQD